MKYNIHITHAAERDMANAYDYIDLVLKNPTAADKLLDVADEKIGALDRKSTRLNSSHMPKSRMPSSA